MNNDSEIVIKPIKAFKEGDAGNPDLEPFADWATISQFEVRVNKRSKFTARVYANGYQQVPIEILIEARDSNGVVVNLSADQLRNIRLIDYDTAEPLGDMHYFHDPRFIYQWEPILGEGGDVDGDIHNGDELPESRAQSMTWYGKKFNVSASKVAAEITSPSGGVFRTNTPNAAPGKFDSWITVLGVEEPLYDHRDLEMERVDEVTNSIWDIDLYYIRFSNREFNIVDSAQLDGYPSVPYHSSLHPLVQSRYHIAFKYGPQFTMEFEGVDGLPGVSFEVNKRLGQATAARCNVNLLRYYDLYRGHACMWYFNQYGNRARCGLGNTYVDDYNMVSLGGSLHG